jgi:acyl carrier protein
MEASMNESQVYPLVANIWCEILGVETAQPADSFFDFGGTSIAAEQIASRISDALPVAMNSGDILKRRTLSNVVELVVSRMT